MSAVGTCKSAGIKAGPRNLLRARCEMDGLGRDCRILDITSRRAFVESFVPAPTGSRVMLHFSLPNGHQVCTAGVVSYHQLKVGFSVDFTELSANDRAQINSFVG